MHHHFSNDAQMQKTGTRLYVETWVHYSLVFLLSRVYTQATALGSLPIPVPDGISELQYVIGFTQTDCRLNF